MGEGFQIYACEIGISDRLGGFVLGGCERERQINSFLIDDHTDELTSLNRNLVGVRLTACDLSLDRLARNKRLRLRRDLRRHAQAQTQDHEYESQNSAH